MTKQSMRLSDAEILSRLMNRRDLVRIGAASALAAPAILGSGRDAQAQSTAGTATAGEQSIYRPASPVGTPQPEPSGPVENAVGPPPGEASPVPGIATDAFMDLSLALVGGGRLDPDRGGQLLALIASNSEGLTALKELLTIREGGAATTLIATPVATLSGDARGLVEQILRFWYLGTWDGQPVTDRAGFWFSLSAWQAVKYTYAPSVCRAFGIWAEAPPS